MRKWLLSILWIIICMTVCQAQPVNGDTLHYDGKLILRVWGNHYERGYAHGYLMGSRIKDVFDNYMIGYIFQNNPTAYAAALAFFQTYFQVETKYEQEVEGMFQGMVDAGIDLYNAALGRNLGVADGLMTTAAGDLDQYGGFGMQMHMGCSTISSWGSSTQQDPELNGSLIVTRHFDWDMHATFLANQMMIIHFPSEEDENAWVNFGLAGCIAPFSSLNENGMAAFLNVGNYNTNTNLDNFHPISLSIRNGIETDDYNGDLTSDQQDVADAVNDYHRIGSWIVTAVSASEGIVVECNNTAGLAVRTEAHNTVIPENQIVATNHHRLLYTPVSCSRYSAIADSLSNNASITVARSWGLLCGAAGVPWNVHTIGFAPTAGLVKWATAPNNWTPAYTEQPTQFDLATLFDPPNHVASTSLQPGDFDVRCFPNPFNPTITISFDLPVVSPVELNFFNVEGSCVEIQNFKSILPGHHSLTFDGSHLPSGIYFYRLTTGNFTNVGKLVLLK